LKYWWNVCENNSFEFNEIFAIIDLGEQTTLMA
jgi:hypothetical protein